MINIRRVEYNKNMKQFQYTNNVYGKYGKDPRRLLSSQNLANLEVEMHWRNRQEELTEVPRSKPHMRDHVKELWGRASSSRPMTSSYKETHEESKELVDERTNHDFFHHKKKDWLKEYFERLNQNKTVTRK